LPHSVLFPYQTAWQYSDGNLLTGASSAGEVTTTDHGEFITQVTDKQQSLLMAGNSDEVYDKKPSMLHQRLRYAVVNLKPK